MNLPTAITLCRFLLVPVFIMLERHYPLWGAVVFIVAALTDFLDGYLARRSRQITKLGIILDPLADKVLVISALIVLVDLGLLAAWIGIVIVIREFLVTGLRLFALAKDLVIPSEAGGKFKTGFQIAAIIIFLLGFAGIPDGIDLHWAGLICIWIAMILGLWSGAQYFIRFWREV